jgi:hypothetical protein
MKRLVWLASYPKSGNTWLRVFIANLVRGRIEKRRIGINEIGIGEIASSRHLFDIYSGVNSLDLNFDEIENLRPQVYRSINEYTKDFVFLKTHDAYLKTSNGSDLIPSEATWGVVYIVRNPLDIVASYANHLGVTLNEAISVLEDEDRILNNRMCGRQLRQRLCSWSRHVESWVVDAVECLPVHVVRYEDMLTDTESVFEGISRFLNLSYSKEEIHLALGNASFDVLRSEEEASGFREGSLKASVFFRKGVSGEWRRELSAEQVDRVFDCHGHMMERMGYTGCVRL